MTDQPYAPTPAGAAATPKEVQTAFRLWIANGCGSFEVTSASACFGLR